MNICCGFIGVWEHWKGLNALMRHIWSSIMQHYQQEWRVQMIILRYPLQGLISWDVVGKHIGKNYGQLSVYALKWCRYSFKLIIISLAGKRKSLFTWVKSQKFDSSCYVPRTLLLTANHFIFLQSRFQHSSLVYSWNDSLFRIDVYMQNLRGFTFSQTCHKCIWQTYSDCSYIMNIKIKLYVTKGIKPRFKLVSVKKSI